MDTLLEAIQDVVIAEPETESQPDPTQPVDTVIETQLTNQISSLWTEHTRLSADRRMTAVELRQIRASLAERLYDMKTLLSRPGRGGQWRGWLRERAIPRSTADRLVSRHAETLGSGNEGNVPSGATSEEVEANAEKLARNVWSRFGKVLTTEDSVIDFIVRIAEFAGVAHEKRAEGLLIFKPAPTAAEELPATAPAPPELGLAVAAAETSIGDVV